jgi:hypothetical protein
MASVTYHVPCLTTLAAARAAAAGIADSRAHPLVVRALQDLHGAVGQSGPMGQSGLMGQSGAVGQSRP